MDVRVKAHGGRSDKKALEVREVDTGKHSFDDVQLLLVTGEVSSFRQPSSSNSPYPYGKIWLFEALIVQEILQPHDDFCHL